LGCEGRAIVTAWLIDVGPLPPINCLGHADELSTLLLALQLVPPLLAFLLILFWYLCFFVRIIIVGSVFYGLRCGSKGRYRCCPTAIRSAIRGSNKCRRRSHCRHHQGHCHHADPTPGRRRRRVRRPGNYFWSGLDLFRLLSSSCECVMCHVLMVTVGNRAIVLARRFGNERFSIQRHQAPAVQLVAALRGALL
jgi:hypothetical protein